MKSHYDEAFGPDHDIENPLHAVVPYFGGDPLCSQGGVCLLVHRLSLGWEWRDVGRGDAELDAGDCRAGV